MAERPKPVEERFRAKILTNSWSKLLPKPLGKTTKTSRPHDKRCSMAWFCSSFSFISWPKRADKLHKTSFVLSISTIKSRWSDLKDSCHSNVSHTNFSSGFSLYIWESLPSFDSGRNATFNGIVAGFSSFPPPSPLSPPLPPVTTSSLGFLISRHVEGRPSACWEQEVGTYSPTFFLKHFSFLW